ncbi:MAG TPA: hypothetical protein V6C85_25980 [Allocoleopsis sp.]
MNGENRESSMNISVKEQLLKEIEKTSDSTLKEVLDFLLFLKSRELQQEQLEISMLSEPSLAEDWLTPEEDEAWQHL